MNAINATIRISSFGRSPIRDEFAVVELRLLDEARAALKKTVVPAVIGTRVSVEPVALIPGRYVAHARLPSGEQLTEEFVIQKHLKSQRITLGLGDRAFARSSHGRTGGSSMGWQPSNYGALVRLDQVPTVEFLSNGFSIVSEARDMARSYDSAVKLGSGIGQPLDVTKTFPLVSLPEKGRITGQRLVGFLHRARTNDSAHPAFEVITGHGTANTLLTKIRTASPTFFQRDTKSFLDSLDIQTSADEMHMLTAASRRCRIHVSSNQAIPAEGARYVILQPSAPFIGDERKNRTKIARIPGPWRIKNTGRLAGVTIDTHRGTKRETPRLGVAIDDPSMNTVLGFSQQKDLDGALTILERSLDALMHKIENPYAAAAAGYVLLAAPWERVPPNWHTWVGNLGSWFPDLPDGNILHATLLLQSLTPWTGESDHDRYFPLAPDERATYAAELIFEALRRGIPLYRAGLGLLASNLRILMANRTLPEDVRSQLQDADTFIHVMRSRVDTSQPFTVVDVTDLY